MYDPATVLISLHNKVPSKCVGAAAFLVFCTEAIEFSSWREQSLASVSYFNGHLFTLSLCHLFYPLITNVGRTQFTIVSVKTSKRDLNAGLCHCICLLILNPEGIKGQETSLSFLNTVTIDKWEFIVQRYRDSFTQQKPENYQVNPDLCFTLRSISSLIPIMVQKLAFFTER